MAAIHHGIAHQQMGNGNDPDLQQILLQALNPPAPLPVHHIAFPQTLQPPPHLVHHPLAIHMAPPPPPLPPPPPTSGSIRRDFQDAYPAIFYAITDWQPPRFLSLEHVKRTKCASPMWKDKETETTEMPIATTQSFVSARNSSPLVNLPTEIILQIIVQLNQVFSASLGVTCKDFYTLHRQRHGSVPLSRFARHASKNYQLGNLLSSWVGFDFIFMTGPSACFVRKSHLPTFLADLEKEEQRHDKVLRRLVEQDLMTWEATIWRVGVRSGAAGMPWVIKQKLAPWEWQCEKALASGYEIGWLFKPAEVNSASQEEDKWRIHGLNHDLAFARQ